LRTGSFIVATGAQPVIPSIPGLDQVPYLTYQQVFDNDQLPGRVFADEGIRFEPAQRTSVFCPQVIVGKTIEVLGDQKIVI
jgi:hypothetical protein